MSTQKKIIELSLIEINRKLEEANEELSVAKLNFEDQKKNSLLSEKTISMKREVLSKKERFDYWASLKKEAEDWISELN